MSDNRVLSVEELCEESFEVLYDELTQNWGTTLANTALGIPSMEVIFASELDQMEQAIPGASGAIQPETNAACAFCMQPMQTEDLPFQDAPFGICEQCKQEFELYFSDD